MGTSECDGWTPRPCRAGFGNAPDGARILTASDDKTARLQEAFPISDALVDRAKAEGIAKAKAAGVYKGRPASIDVTKVREMKAQGMGASEIAKALKIGRASVYRALGEGA